MRNVIALLIAAIASLSVGSIKAADFVPFYVGYAYNSDGTIFLERRGDTLELAKNNAYAYCSELSEKYARALYGDSPWVNDCKFGLALPGDKYSGWSIRLVECPSLSGYTMMALSPEYGLQEELLGDPEIFFKIVSEREFYTKCRAYLPEVGSQSVFDWYSRVDMTHEPE